MPAFVFAATGLPAELVVAVIVLGAIVAIGGHIARARAAVVAGIAILFAGSALMVVGGYLSYRDNPNDPRPCAEAGTCE